MPPQQSGVPVVVQISPAGHSLVAVHSWYPPHPPRSKHPQIKPPSAVPVQKHLDRPWQLKSGPSQESCPG